MPRRTRKGRIAWEQIRGLEEYISRAEVDDLKAQERRRVFERLLPYATAFSLTTRWASAFEGLYTQPPDWYRPAGDGPFNMMYFGSSLDRSVDRDELDPADPAAVRRGSGAAAGRAADSAAAAHLAAASAAAAVGRGEAGDQRAAAFPHGFFLSRLMSALGLTPFTAPLGAGELAALLAWYMGLLSAVSSVGVVVASGRVLP